MVRQLITASPFSFDPPSEYAHDVGKVRCAPVPLKSAVVLPFLPFDHTTVNPVRFVGFSFYWFKRNRLHLGALNAYRHAPAGVVDCFYGDAGTVLPPTIAVRRIPLLQPTQFVGHVATLCSMIHSKHN